MNLQDTIQCFENLKKQGVSKDEILDVLEFDSDEYPDMKILEKAREVVYGMSEKQVKQNREAIVTRQYNDMTEFLKELRQSVRKELIDLGPTMTKRLNEIIENGEGL